MAPEAPAPPSTNPQGPSVPAPAAARALEAERIVRLVSRGVSVELLGVRWAGRTEVLGRVRQALTDTGIDVLNVRGRGGARPLEAVRVALPPVYREAIHQNAPGSVISDAVGEFLGDSPSVVMIDDCDRLDDASWEVLISAAMLHGRPVVASRQLRSQVGPREHLLSESAHPVVQITLGELRLEALHTILEDRLDGALSPSVSARIHTASSGIPGLALAQLDGAVEHGLLRRQGELWTAGADLWTDDLHGTYQAMLHAFEPDVREAVELLSLVGTVDVRAARALVGTELLEALEDVRLVRLTAVGAWNQGVVAVHPPGLAAYFAHQPPTVRRQRIVDDALARVQERGLGLDGETVALLRERLRTSAPAARDDASRLGGRGPVQSAAVPVVARMFAESYDIQLAKARRRWDGERTRAAALPYLRLLLTGLGDPEEFERVLETLPAQEPGEGVDALYLRHAHSRWLLSQGGSVDEAVRALVQDVPEGYRHAEALDTLARAVRWELETLDPSYADILEPRAAHSGFDGHVAGLVLAACHMFAGRPVDSLRVLDALEGSDDWDPRLGLELGSGALRGLGLVASSRLPEAIRWAALRAHEALSDLDRVSFATYSFVGAVAQIVAGSLEEAQDTLTVVLGSGIVTRCLPFSPDRAILVAMAVISSRSGREVTAARLLEHSRQVLGTSDALPLGSSRWAEATAMASMGDTVAAAGIFAELVAGARAHGYHLAADLASLISLFFHYDPELAAQTRDRAEVLGGGIYTALIDARAAAHDGDPSRVEASAHRLLDVGGSRDALRFFTLAVSLYRDRGDLESAAGARVQAQALAEHLGLPSRQVLGLGEPDFTAREIEVIQMVAEGRSNSEIAAAMFIGIRTVESHMRNIRRKSGAADRAEIARLA